LRRLGILALVERIGPVVVHLALISRAGVAGRIAL
jgi:hypothetical protein